MASIRSFRESTGCAWEKGEAELMESIWCSRAVADRTESASFVESRRRMESRARVRESRTRVRESRGGRRVSRLFLDVSIFGEPILDESILDVSILDVSTAWVRESVDGGLTGGWAFAARQTPQQIRTSISSLLINNRGVSLKMLKTGFYCIK
jgi:hypothetical protein